MVFLPWLSGTGHPRQSLTSLDWQGLDFKSTFFPSFSGWGLIISLLLTLTRPDSVEALSEDSLHRVASVPAGILWRLSVSWSKVKHVLQALVFLRALFLQSSTSVFVLPDT